jgi:hypothetical protein
VFGWDDPCSAEVDFDGGVGHVARKCSAADPVRSLQDDDVKSPVGEITGRNEPGKACANDDDVNDLGRIVNRCGVLHGAISFDDCATPRAGAGA